MLVLSTILAYSQNNVTIAPRDLRADSMAIKQTCLDYIEGYYNADAQRMAKAVDPELVKRIIFKDPAGDVIQNMGATLLLLNTRRNKNANVINNNEPFKATVTIFDIGNNIAAAKIETNKLKFFDYVQLGRMNGEWRIINVLWENLNK